MELRTNKMKEFTYEECLKFSEEKNKIIQAYQNRKEAIYEFIESHIERDPITLEVRNKKPIDPERLLHKIKMIEWKHSLVK